MKWSVARIISQIVIDCSSSSSLVVVMEIQEISNDVHVAKGAGEAEGAVALHISPIQIDCGIQGTRGDQSEVSIVCCGQELP